MLAQLSTPDPFVCKYCPVVPPVTVTLPTAPKLVVPDTLSDPALTLPVVVKFPPVILPVAVTNPPKYVAPLDTKNEYALVIVMLLPAVGAPDIQNVAALVAVTLALAALNNGTPIP